jgi:hypothetical protein
LHSKPRLVFHLALAMNWRDFLSLAGRVATGKRPFSKNLQEETGEPSMSPAALCISDTLRLVLDRAKEAQLANSDSSDVARAFETGRAQAFTESLHTWSNQIQTFGLQGEIGPVWDDIWLFLKEHGF